MKRTAEKLCEHLVSEARKLRADVQKLPEGTESPALDRAALVLRDAIAAIRAVRLRIEAQADARGGATCKIGD